MTRKTKTILISSLVLIFTYQILTSFPKGEYSIVADDIKIQMSLSENLLVFRDPQCTKYIEITDGNKSYTIEFTSPEFDTKVYKRNNGKEEFWIVDDLWTGLSRTKNGEFLRFSCWDPGCWTFNPIEGKTSHCFHFDEDHWVKANNPQHCPESIE